jgi:hypothetical protein
LQSAILSRLPERARKRAHEPGRVRGSFAEVML